MGEKVILTSALAVSVVKAPEAAVVAPIWVALIPVAVVLKVEAPVPEVIVRALVPVLMLDALRPDRVKAPEVAVRLAAPVVRVRPLLAVSKPAEVMVPEPVAEILPEVEIVPSSLMVSLDTAPDLISMAVLVPALESSRIKAAAVPSWVRVKDWSVVKSAKVKAMFLASVVVIVLPETAS